MRLALGLLFATAAVLSACGPANPEVRVVLTEDGSLPCLGAKHIKILVDLQEGNYVFDEFADPVYFDLDTHQCLFNQQLNYDRLALAPAVRVDVSLQDSTTGPAEQHILAQGSTVTFSVTESSPVQEWVIPLSRRPEASPGTAYLEEPPGWDNIKQGISHLSYLVYQEDDQGVITNRVREHSLAYESRTYPEPWPVIISNLPSQEVGELYKVKIDGLDGTFKSVRFWIGEIFLQAHTIAWVNWAG